MKRVLAVLLSVVMLLSSFAVNANSLDFLRKSYNNYSSQAQTYFSIDNVDGLLTSIESVLEISFENDYVDLAMLLKSISESAETVYVKADISEDYKKIKMSMSDDASLNVDINENFNFEVNAKTAMWIDMDISDAMNPKFMVVVSSPASTKYVYIDVVETVFSKLDQSQQLLVMTVLYSLFDEEFISAANDAVIDSFEKNATITENDGVYTVALDNEGFLKVIDDVIDFVAGEVFELFSAFMPEQEGVSTDVVEIPQIAELGLKILGENGFVTKYTFDEENVSSAEISCDLEISLKNVFEVFGEVYPYEQDIAFEATFGGTELIFDVGTTTVEFPVLTEDNSINLSDELFADYETDYEYDWFSMNYQYKLDEDVLYVPFEELINKGFANLEFVYDYQDNNVSVEVAGFEGFEKLSFNVGETSANVDGNSVSVGDIIEKDGTVYVSELFINSVFGWEAGYAYCDLLTATMYVEIDKVPDMYDWDDYEDEEAEILEEYPEEYLSGEEDYLPVVDGEMYYPFRTIMQDAFGDTVQIEFNNGVITTKCEYFDGFKTLSFTIGESVAYTDKETVEVGKIILEDGTTYVSCAFVENALKWSVSYASYNYMTQTYCYEIYTGENEDDANEYPYYWSGMAFEYMPKSDNCLYLPMELAFAESYSDNVKFEYEDATVAITSKYFTEFDTILLTVGSEKALVDTNEVTLDGAVLLENDIVYVPVSLFTDVFGWLVDCAEYYPYDNTYYFSFECYPEFDI